MVSTRDITYNLHKLVFLMDKIADKLLQENLDITFSQLRILIAMNHQSVSQKDIANFWDMTEAAVSRQIESLVEKGLIARVENTENRRENSLSLTAEGKVRFNAAVHLLDKRYSEIYSVLDEREHYVLVDGLHKLLNAICTNKHADPFIHCPKQK